VTARHCPGFILAKIHKSLNGTRMANDAPWRSVEDLRAMPQRHQVRKFRFTGICEPS
jgi:hypothetical protein